MKKLWQFAGFITLAIITLGASFPYVTLNNKTNRLSDNGTAFTRNGVAIGSGGIAGTVSNNVASAGLLSVDVSKTNGIAATAAHITNAWGIFTGDTTKAVSGAGTLVSLPTGIEGTVIASGTPAVGDLLSASSTSGTNGVWSAPVWTANPWPIDPDWADSIAINPTFFTNGLAGGPWIFMQGNGFAPTNSMYVTPTNAANAPYLMISPASNTDDATEGGTFVISQFGNINDIDGTQYLGGGTTWLSAHVDNSALNTNLAYFAIMGQRATLDPNLQFPPAGETIFGVGVDFIQPWILSADVGANLSVPYGRIGVNIMHPRATLEVVSWANYSANIDANLDIQQWRLWDGTLLASVSTNGLIASTSGFASTASDATIAISATGLTNTLGKNAVARMDGTNLVYVIKNNAGTAIYTNSIAVGRTTELLQSGGALVITSGTLTYGNITPF